MAKGANPRFVVASLRRDRWPTSSAEAVEAWSEEPEFSAGYQALSQEFVHESEDAADAAQIGEIEVRVAAGDDEHVMTSSPGA